jgi:hypothetical protein
MLLSPYTVNVNGRNFSAVKNLITVGCLNHVLTIFHFGWQKTGVRIVVGPRLHEVEGRYHMTVWNWFSSSFQYSLREGKTLSVTYMDAEMFRFI